jgi:hypothetical protein
LPLEERVMKTAIASLTIALLMLGGFTAVLAGDVKDKVKVEIESVGLHPGMDPGMYVCASGHLHIKGSVQNLADVALGQVKVAGKAFDVKGKLLGMATYVTKETSLGPGEKTEINLEFLTVTGPMIQEVKRHEVMVIEAPAKQ